MIAATDAPDPSAGHPDMIKADREASTAYRFHHSFVLIHHLPWRRLSAPKD